MNSCGRVTASGRELRKWYFRSKTLVLSGLMPVMREDRLGLHQGYWQ